MVVGTQIALEFPESSQPPPISREKVHIVKDESETALPRRVLADPPGNLQDLLGAIAISDQLQPDQQAMLRSTAAHLSRFLGYPPAELEIATLADSLQPFKDYLLNRRFKRNSVRTYMNFAQLLLRAARALGWTESSSGLVEAWKEVLPIAKRYHCARVGGYAVRKGLAPGQFTEAQLEEMAQAMVKEGRTFHYATQMQWRFRNCVHESGLQKDFPGISPPRKKTLYGIPLSQFPVTLRNEVSNLLAWKTDLYVDDRPLRSKKLRPPSAARLKENFCQLYGFANNIKGFDPSTLADLLSQDCLGEFLKWSETERKVKMSSLLKSVWMIVPIVRDYPPLRGRDFSWIGNRLAAMRIRAEHSASEGAACGVEYDSLARIPALIRREAEKCNPERGKKKAVFIRDQLLIMMLVVLVWRQRNVRECKLRDRKDSGNLFKEEVSPRSRTALPNSVLAALEQNPHQKFWQFCFRPEETKAGRADLPPENCTSVNESSVRV